MRLKYYMRGLGTGILFSVVVFGLTGAKDKTTMSDTEIIHAAKALGMVEAQSQVDLTALSPTPTVTPGEEQKPTSEASTEPTVEPSVTPLVEPTVEPSVTPLAEPTVEPSVTPLVEPTSMPTSTPQPTLEPTKAPEDGNLSEKQTVILTIHKGMYSRDVAEEAYRIGLVDSAEEFDKYLIEHGYASNIHINSYEFEQGATSWEIANKITTPQ